MLTSRTPPGVRELKLIGNVGRDPERKGRTPPGVRELKLTAHEAYKHKHCRTPPGVRELKLFT